MEGKLKNLSVIIDKEISTSKVFTECDERQILSGIKQLSNSKAQPKKQFSFVPSLLTAVLFSGIIFTSYIYFDKEFTSNPNVHPKKEAPLFTQQVSGEGSAQYLADQKQLTIKLDIKNESNTTIKKPFKHRITFLNAALEKAVGINSFTIESKDQTSLTPGQSTSLSKQFVLQQDIAKEDLIDSIHIETMNDAKTMDSYVIEKIDYEEAEQNTNEDFPLIQNVQIEKRDGKFYANGVTLETSIEEAFEILNQELDILPNKFTYFPIGKGYDDPNFQDDHLTLNYSNDRTVTFIGITIIKSDALLQDIYDLGEPYHKSETGIDWYYDKDTNQLLSVSETDEGKLSINIRYKNQGDPF